MDKGDEGRERKLTEVSQPLAISRYKTLPSPEIQNKKEAENYVPI